MTQHSVDFQQIRPDGCADQWSRFAVQAGEVYVAVRRFDCACRILVDAVGRERYIRQNDTDLPPCADLAADMLTAAEYVHGLSEYAAQKAVSLSSPDTMRIDTTAIAREMSEAERRMAQVVSTVRNTDGQNPPPDEWLSDVANTARRTHDLAKSGTLSAWFVMNDTKNAAMGTDIHPVISGPFAEAAKQVKEIASVTEPQRSLADLVAAATR